MNRTGSSSRGSATHQNNEVQFYESIEAYSVSKDISFVPAFFGVFDSDLDLSNSSSEGAFTIPRGSIFMEYIEDNLFAMLTSMPDCCALTDRVGLCHAFLKAVRAFHALGLVHRDLKPENVCMSKESDCSVSGRLIDFEFVVPSGSEGVAGPVRADDQYAFVGTPRYMPPECIGPQVTYTAAYDMFMVAVVCLQIFGGSVDLSLTDQAKLGYLPNHLKRRYEIEHRTIEYPKGIPLSVHKCLTRGLGEDITARPMADEMLAVLEATFPESL